MKDLPRWTEGKPWRILPFLPLPRRHSERGCPGLLPLSLSPCRDGETSGGAKPPRRRLRGVELPGAMHT